MLSPNERKVLRGLESGPATGDDLAARTGLSPDAALSAAFQLQQKGLVDLREERKRTYRLTAEGELYQQKGLPERRLLGALVHGPIAISALDEWAKPPRNVLSPHEIPIVPGWILRKGWAKRTQEGSLERAVSGEEPPPGDDERLLKRLASGPGDAEHTVADALVKRGLLAFQERTSRRISLSPAGRKALAEGVEEAAEEIGDLTRDLLKSGGWKGKAFRPYDVTLPAAPHWGGKRNPYSRLLDELRQIFLEMGFREIRGEVVQPAFWNFDALFQPQDHPARDMQDTFYLEREAPLPPVAKRVKAVHETGAGAGSRGWRRPWDPAAARKLVLRTHTTAVTIRHLAAHPEPPVRAFCIDRVYRRENADPTHLPEFDQLEGVVLEEGANFRHLMGLLREFYRRAGFPEARFRPGYFPYTEPSLEVEVKWKERWVELGGA
ncbi:MAG: phenylalanine--tRNA ligase subunit alpha, partial [Halobacteria archaeon]